MGIKRTLLKNSFFNLVSYAYLLLTAFFSIPVILNALGSDLFGLYILLASIVPLVSVLDFGLGSAVVRELSLPDFPKKDYIDTWRTSFSLFFLGGSLLSILVIGLLRLVPNYWDIFNQINSHTMIQIGYLLGLTVFFNHLNAHLLNLPQARQQFEIFNLKTLLVGTGNTLITAVAVTFTKNLADLFLIQFIFHFTTFVLLVFYSRNIFHGRDFFPGFKKQTSIRLISFGLKNFIGTLSSQVEAQASKYVIGANATAAAVTAFSIPQNIILKAAGVVSQVALSIFPTSASLLNRDRISKLKKLVFAVQALTLTFGVLGVVFTFTFGESFLTWWLKNPEVVILSTPILKILSFYLLLTSLTPIPTVVLIALNQPQIPSIFALLTVIIEVVFLILLVPSLQAVGAALATLGAALLTVPLFLLIFFHHFIRYEKNLFVSTTKS